MKRIESVPTTVPHRFSSLRLWPRPAMGWLVACAVLTASGGQARAQQQEQQPGAPQQPDPKVIARSKLVDGGELLKRGDYREALARFKEAYDLVQSPKIQYNFGLAYRGLGRNADAIEAFEKFLNDATDASPDLRANAERYRSALGQQTISVVIDSDVDGAEISVDGRSYGVTPAKAAIRLDPGPHQLVVEKAGAPAFMQKVDGVGGQRLTVQVKLARALPPVPGPMAPPAAVPPPDAALVPPLAPPSATEGGHTWRWKASLGGAAVAVAFIGFGIVERLGASSKYDEFNKRKAPLGKCDADDRVLEHGGGDCAALLSAGDSAATKATVGFVLGGLLGAASVAALALTWNERTAPNGVALLGCGPVVSREPAMTCALRF